MNMSIPAVGSSTLGGHDQSDDQSVEPEDLSEDQDEDHADEQLGLNGCRPDRHVPHDPDRVPSTGAAQTDAQTGSEVHETPDNQNTA